MDLSRVLFDLGLLFLLLVVGMGWTAIVVECINALLRDRAKARKYKEQLRQQDYLRMADKAKEIEGRPGGLPTAEEMKEGWHYCDSFDSMLIQTDRNNLNDESRCCKCDLG